MSLYPLPADSEPSVSPLVCVACLDPSYCVLDPLPCADSPSLLPRPLQTSPLSPSPPPNHLGLNEHPPVRGNQNRSHQEKALTPHEQQGTSCSDGYLDFQVVDAASLPSGGSGRWSYVQRLSPHSPLMKKYNHVCKSYNHHKTNNQVFSLQKGVFGPANLVFGNFVPCCMFFLIS